MYWCLFKVLKGSLFLTPEFAYGAVHNDSKKQNANNWTDSENTKINLPNDGERPCNDDLLKRKFERGRQLMYCAQLLSQFDSAATGSLEWSLWLGYFMRNVMPAER